MRQTGSRLSQTRGVEGYIFDGAEAGQEYLIPRGTPHGEEALAGTRTIHALGGHRANRLQDQTQA
jgi:hypothetical protein